MVLEILFGGGVWLCDVQSLCDGEYLVSHFYGVEVWKQVPYSVSYIGTALNVTRACGVWAWYVSGGFPPAKRVSPAPHCSILSIHASDCGDCPF